MGRLKNSLMEINNIIELPKVSSKLSFDSQKVAVGAEGTIWQAVWSVVEQSEPTSPAMRLPGEYFDVREYELRTLEDLKASGQIVMCQKCNRLEAEDTDSSCIHICKLCRDMPGWDK